MEKSIDVAAYELKSQIIDLINNSGLPLCLVDYVTTEIANHVKGEYIALIQRETSNLEALNDPALHEKEEMHYPPQLEVVKEEKGA